MIAVFIAIISIILGALWRRWFGGWGGDFPRWVKLIVVVFLGGAIAFYWTRSPALAAVVGLALMAGWTAPAQFGKIDNDFTWPLLARYGGVTAASALVAAVMMNDILIMLYAPVGLFACLGYTVGKKIYPACWTCVGECWLGASIYGGLAILKFH